MDDAVAVRMKEALEETARQSLRAGGIIRHLREFVMRGETEKAPEDIRKLIEEAGALALVGSRERGVRSVFDFSPGVATVMVDRVQIQQVLINLMRNAMEAMRDSERRELVIRTSSGDEGSVIISVGYRPGISDEIAARCSSLRDQQARRHGDRAVHIAAHRGSAWRRIVGSRNAEGGATFSSRCGDRRRAATSDGRE